MLSRRRRNFLFIEAAILTLCIYFIGLFVNSYLDESRLSVLDENIIESQIQQRSSFAFNEFQKQTYSNNCNLSKQRILEEHQQLKEFATDISNFGLLFNKNNEDFSKLRQREFYLLQTQLYFSLEEYNEVCENTIVPGWYFFDGNSASFDRQAANLETFVLSSNNGSIIFSYDVNFAQNEPIIEKLMDKFDVSFVPFVVLGNMTHHEFGQGLIGANRLIIEYRRQIGELE